MATPAPKQDRSNIRIQAVILVVGVLLLGGKFLAYYITNSNAILSDALESIVNIIAGGFGLYSLILSAKPRDKDHPYGHGKIEFISATVEGVLISVAGIAICIKAISGLISPVPLQQLDLGLLLVAFTAVANYVMGYVAVWQGKRSSSLALIASGLHLKTDTYTTFAIIAGLLLIRFTGLQWLDGVIAIAMGIWVLYNGVMIVRSSVAGIMDEADFETLQAIIENLNRNRRENWVDVHNLRMVKYGPNIHIDCHATLPWYFTLEEAHNEVGAIEQCFYENVPNYLEAFIHADPCLPSSCPSCIKQDCPHRKEEFRKKITWKLENVLSNTKHTLKD